MPHWRTGTKNPHTLYVDDEPAGFVLDPELAKFLVKAANAAQPKLNPKCNMCTRFRKPCERDDCPV